MNIDPQAYSIVTEDNRVFVDAEFLLKEYRHHNNILAMMAEYAPDPEIARAKVEGANAILRAIEVSIVALKEGL